MLPELVVCKSDLKWTNYHFVRHHLSNGREEGLYWLKANLFVILCLIQMLII